MRQVLIKLGLVGRGGNYETVRRRIAELDLPAVHLRERKRGRGVRSCTDDEIRCAVARSRSFAEALVALGVRPGGNQSRLRLRVEQLGLDSSHFLGQGWRRGATTPVVRAIPLQEVLVEGRWTQTSTLKRRLMESGLKRWMCEMCLRETWNRRAIPLELDHMNGRRDDNRLENLRVLCPNCHAQTDTYRGRNIGVARTV